MPAWLTVKPLLWLSGGLLATLLIVSGVATVKVSIANTATANAEKKTAKAELELAEIRADIAEAGEKARGEAVERDATGENIADTTRTEAQAVVTEQQQTTAAAVERVRTIIKTVQVPVECPVSLPPEIQDEGRKAVERANGASR